MAAAAAAAAAALALCDGELLAEAAVPYAEAALAALAAADITSVEVLLEPGRDRDKGHMRDSYATEEAGSEDGSEQAELRRDPPAAAAAAAAAVATASCPSDMPRYLCTPLPLLARR